MLLLSLKLEAPLCRRSKPLSYSEQLLDKYFILDGRESGLGGSVVEATGSDLLWDVSSRGRPDIFRGSEAPNPYWMPDGPMPRTLVSDF